MKIWGYTQEKEMVAVHLSIEQIAAAGIDPWRLDLFDPDPRSLDLDGKRIYFRKVQDLCFAIKASDTEVAVGMHDGETAVCLSGEPFAIQQRSLRLRRVKAHPAKFTALYQQFLELVSQETPSDSPRVPPRYVFEEKPYMDPLSACAVKIHGDSLEIRDWNTSLKSFAFVGEMFKEVQVCVHLPAQVAWLFQEFGQWHPTVRFALESMVGWRLKKISFTVDTEGEKEIRRRFCKADTSRFRANRCSYELCTRGSLSESAKDWGEDTLSVLSAYSSKPNELRCSRIGFHDLAQRQARVQRRTCYFPEREIELMLKGFRMLDGPWEASRREWRAYRLLKAGIPGAGFAYGLLSKAGRLAGDIWFGAIGKAERANEFVARARDWLLSPSQKP